MYCDAGDSVIYMYANEGVVRVMQMGLFASNCLTTCYIAQ